ncbi:hypothetical protein ACIBRY_16825 [Streptomyces anulatus]
MAVARRLVLADIAYQYTVASVEDAPVCIVELAPEQGSGTRAVEYLRQGDTAARTVSVLDATGKAQTPEPPAEPTATWARTGLDEGFTDYLRTALAALGRPLGADSGNGPLEALAPVMLLRTHADERQPFTEVLMCTRMRAIGVLFTRVAQFTHSVDVELDELVATAFKHRTALENFVRVEDKTQLLYEQDIEIEEKITLRDEANIWSLTQSMWTAVEAGDLPGFIPDPGYELTRWHFVQHNYEVTSPVDRVGHFAFQEYPDGRYRLKMKKFAKDSLRRVETFRNGIEVPDADFDGYLAREFPDLGFKRLPSLRRTKFDINIQSVATGHCFGIETDEVTLSDGTGRTMRQVETEYLDTRRHDGMDGSTIDAELSRLTTLVGAHLAGLGISAERGLYSKLSYLRDSSQTADH